MAGIDRREPPERWGNDELIRRAEQLAADGRDGAEVLRELARRYQAAIRNERARYASAAEAFGIKAPSDRRDGQDRAGLPD